MSDAITMGYLLVCALVISVVALVGVLGFWHEKRYYRALYRSAMQDRCRYKHAGLKNAERIAGLKRQVSDLEIVRDKMDSDLDVSHEHIRMMQETIDDLEKLVQMKDEELNVWERLTTEGTKKNGKDGQAMLMQQACVGGKVALECGHTDRSLAMVRTPAEETLRLCLEGKVRDLKRMEAVNENLRKENDILLKRVAGETKASWQYARDLEKSWEERDKQRAELRLAQAEISKLRSDLKRIHAELDKPFIQVLSDRLEVRAPVLEEGNELREQFPEGNVATENTEKHGMEGQEGGATEPYEKPLFLEMALSPRLSKVLASGKEFLLVTETEPYYLDVYRIIRQQEKEQGTWTQQDEERYVEALEDRIKELDSCLRRNDKKEVGNGEGGI